MRVGKSTTRRIVPGPAEQLFPLGIVIIGHALEENMKKIALLTASLALLASPVLAEEAKTTGAAPAEDSSVPDQTAPRLLVIAGLAQARLRDQVPA